MEGLRWRPLLFEGGPLGSTPRSATEEGDRGPFGDFSSMNKGFWQCRPIGRGVLQTHKYL